MFISHGWNNSNYGRYSLSLGALTLCYALLHSIMCDLKAAQMNVQHSLIWELYVLKLSHNAMKAIKNICCAKGEGTVNHNAITRWFKKFCLVCKNLDGQAKLGRPKTRDSEAVLQAMELNLVSSIQSIANKLGISQSCVVCHFHNLNKRIWNCQFVSDFTKILQRLWSP